MKNGSFILGHQLKSDQLDARIMNWPIATIPEKRITQNTSPIGIDRALLFDDKAYNNRQIELTLGFEGKNAEDNIRKFMSHLDTGKYEDWVMYSDPNYTYQVTRTASAKMNRPSYSDSYRELTVTLECAPFKYLQGSSIAVSAGDAVTISNPTNYDSKPLVTITVKGDTELTVNGHKTTIKNVQSNIIIDSALQDAYHLEGYTYFNDNNLISVGAYPIFKAGNNTIQLTKGTAKVEGRWRTI